MRKSTTLFAILAMLLPFVGTAQTVYTFTNCGATGRFGPTQAQVNATYTGANTLAGGVTINSQGIQEWTVPVSGLYRIDARGARGGGNAGGSGARIVGEVNLIQGTVLKIAVGQQGGSVGNSCAGGGGGGSFVTTSSNTPLVIAGGGGGANSTASSQRLGLTGTAGGVTTTSQTGIYKGTPGTGGNGSTVSYSYLGGAGGLNTNGSSNSNAVGGQAFVNGAVGGSGTHEGGFGGGGSGNLAGWCRFGGGGGYSGGASGLQSSSVGPFSAGGGGSYNSGTNQVNTAGFNTGHGQVIITQLYGVNITETASIDCNGNANGALTAAGNGGVTPYTYAWSTGATTAAITGLAAGTYTVTLTDANSATTTNSYTLAEPASLAASAVVDANVSCNGGSDGGATASATGGTTAYTYSWSNGATTASITGVAAGTYTATVTDANGCTATSTSTITEPTQLIVTSVLDSNDAGNGGGATASATGGVPPYAYTWSNGATTASVVGVSAGTYSVTVTDANGCTYSASTVIFAGPVLTMSVSSNVSCNGGADGGATVNVTGGTSPFTYTWSNGTTNASLTSVGAGTYSLTVADANGLTDTGSVTITEPTALTLSGTANALYSETFTNGQSYCAGTTQWDNWQSFRASLDTSVGAYVELKVYNNLGNSFSITDQSAIAQIATALKNYTTTSVNVGGVAWSVTTGCGNCTGTADNNIELLVGITSGCSCGSTPTQAVVRPGISNTNWGGIGTATCGGPTQTMNVEFVGSVVQDVTCNGGNDGLISYNFEGGTAPYTYLWNTGATTQGISSLIAGTYTVTVTDASGCNFVQDTVVAEPALLVATSVLDSNDAGNGGGATVSATGGTTPYAYSWSNGVTTATIAGVAANTYYVTVTDANGCTDIDSTVILAGPVFTIAVDSNVSCNGGTDGGATVTVTGGTSPFTYLWSNGATTTSLTAVGAGTYTLTVTDNNGISDTGSVVITEPTALVASSVVDVNVSCNGGADGGATASGTGGTSPYTYSWSNGATTASITGVAAGTYTATVTDANGCTTTTTSTVTEPTSLVASSVVDVNVSCNGGSDGGATASATGGTTAYTYSWSNGATTASITGVAAGTYTATVTDANGCTATSTSTVTEPTALVASSVVDVNVSCNGGADGGATASATGGTSPYTYSWSNSAATASITGVAAGTYTATVTDANGCTATSTSTVTEPTALVASSVVNANVSCNGLSDGSATASATGGTSPYTYSWSNGATTASITGVAAGTYTATVTDANGCTATSTSTVTEPTALVASSVVNVNVSCNGGSDGVATASATGGTTAYTYSWSNGATTASITGVAVGTYTATVTDANGCTATSTSTVTEPTQLIATSVLDSNDAGNGGGATASATGGTPLYTYTWSNGATTASIAGVSAGTYSVTITDGNGCTDSASTVILAGPVFTIGVDSNVSCNGFTDGGATVNVTGGTSPFTYSWSNGTTNGSLTLVGAGTYTLTVTDANGLTDTGSVTITEPAVLLVGSVVNNDMSCYGIADGSGTVSAIGGTSPYSYSWSNGGTTSTVDTLVADTYSITVTDANGCLDSTEVIITEPDSLSISMFVDSTVSCNGLSDGGVSVVVTGGTAGTPGAIIKSQSFESGSSDTWMYTTNPMMFSVFSDIWDTVSSLPNISTLPSSGSMFFGVQDLANTNGGTSVGSPGVIRFDTVHLDGVSPAFISFDYEAYGFDVGDNISYEVWYNGASQGVTALLSPITSNTDASGTEVISIPSGTDSIRFEILVTQNGGSDYAGFDNVKIQYGSPGYIYSWNTGGVSTSLTGLQAGNYTVTVTDNNGCMIMDDTVVSEPDILVLNVLKNNNVNCFGGSDGSATASVTGGTLPYTYNWSTGDTSATSSSFVIGSYTVTVVDTNGCIDSGMISFTQPQPLSMSTASDSTRCFGDSTGVARIFSPLGGVSPYVISWNTGYVGHTLTGVPSGSYVGTLTDANGCTLIDTVEVSDQQPMQITMDVTDATCQFGSDGSILATASSVYGGYSYAWSNATTANPAVGLMDGTSYTVTVTDNEGCTSTSTDQVGYLNAAPMVDLGNDTAYGIPSLVNLASGAVGTHLWSTGDTIDNITLELLSDTTIWVKVTSEVGCVNSDTIRIEGLLGVDGVNEIYTIKLFPNPTNGNLNIQMDDIHAEEVVIQVVDFAGRLVYNREWSQPSEQFIQTIDMSANSQGLYFVNIFVDGHRYTERITVY